jgi:hypothetical protein
VELAVVSLCQIVLAGRPETVLVLTEVVARPDLIAGLEHSNNGHLGGSVDLLDWANPGVQIHCPMKSDFSNQIVDMAG